MDKYIPPRGSAAVQVQCVARPGYSDERVLNMKRSYQEEKSFISREDGQRFRIDPGFVPNMKVGGYLFLV